MKLSKVILCPFFIVCLATSAQTSLEVKEYKKSEVISTNFTVPMVRFNFIEDSEDSLKKGNVTFFNSVGAGVSYNFGRLFQYTNDNNEVVNNEFINIIGFQVGFLFSAETADPPTNNFALTAGVTILDFHFGFGHELGTITEDQKRSFITIAYSIPISKLTKAGLFVRKRGNEVTDKTKDASTF